MIKLSKGTMSGDYIINHRTVPWTERDRVQWTKKGALLSEETQSLARRFIDEARGQCF